MSFDKFLTRLGKDHEDGFHHCVKCHKTYISNYYWQKFCSPRCRTIYNNRRASGVRPSDPEPVEIDLDDLA